MNLAEHLKAMRLITAEQLQAIYSEGERYYLQIKQNEWIEQELLLSEALSFYKMVRMQNTADMKADAEKTMHIGELLPMLAACNIALSTDECEYFLISDPDDIRLVDKIKSAYPGIKLALASDAERESIIKIHVQPLEIQYRASIISKDNGAQLGSKTSETRTEAQRLYRALVDAALENRASDMHITPLKDMVKIAFRIDGKIITYTHIPINILDNIKNIICNEAKAAVSKPFLPIEGKITYLHDGQEIDVRVNIIPSKLGYDINLRFLNRELRSISDIGYCDADMEKYLSLLHMTKGLVVITGPTGCGKTTSLYAGLDALRNSGKKIVALEDPSEITLEGISQIDIAKDNGFGYKEAIASTLRHDPDITLIGETRTLEVAEESIRLADAGHLTITTMHTRDSLSTISRYINLGISPYSLGDSLSAVIAQRLVRRICPYCAEEYTLPKEHYWRDMFELGFCEVKLVRSKGCAHCDGRGYRGRIAIVEFLLTTPEISAAIQDKTNRHTILDLCRRNGFKSMLQDGAQKALLHLTTFDELEPLARDI